MDDNRVANQFEERSIRAYLRTVTKARERHIADAERQVDQRALDVAAADARLLWAQEAAERAQEVVQKAQEAVKTAQLESEQARARSALAVDFLATARSQLDDDPAIRRQQGLIHPVRRYPTELLAMMFVSTVELAYHDIGKLRLFDENPYAEIQTAPYRLALVCRRWREIALRTQEMWRFICLDFSFVHSATASLHALYLETSFERAGKRNVSLTVHKVLRFGGLRFASAEGASLDQQYDALRPLLVGMATIDGLARLNVRAAHELLDTASPCKNLLELSCSGNSPGLVPRLPTHAPNLRVLTMPLSAFFAPAPLAHATIEDMRIELTNLGIPWPRQGDPLQRVFDFAPNARTVAFNFFLVSGIATAHTLTHNHVETLRLAEIGATRLADDYSFPRLRNVIVESLAFNASWEPLLHLVSRGCPNLRTLVLDADFRPDAALVAALKGAPLLESLVCSSGTPDADFFVALTSSNPWKCPNLAQLVVGTVAEDALAEAVMTMVSRRRAAHRRGEALAMLARVSVGRSFALPDDTRMRLLDILYED